MRFMKEIWFIVLCMVLWLCAGCSAIGLGLGHWYDSSRPPTTVTEWDDVITARSGSQIVIQLRNGETVEGRFDGLSQLPDNDYASLYEEMEQSIFITSYVPGVGDSVSCMLLSGTTIAARFVGFDWGYMLLSLPAAGQHRRIPLTQIDHVTDDLGNSVDGDTLRNYVDWGELPIIRTICVQTDIGTVTVMPHEVSKVMCTTIARRPMYGKVFGFVFGFVVDIIFVRTMLWDDE